MYWCIEPQHWGVQVPELGDKQPRDLPSMAQDPLRASEEELTSLERIIDRILRIPLAVVAIFTIMLLSAYFRLALGIPTDQFNDAASVIFNIAPASLFFMIILTLMGVHAPLSRKLLFCRFAAGQRSPLTTMTSGESMFWASLRSSNRTSLAMTGNRQTQSRTARRCLTYETYLPRLGRLLRWSEETAPGMRPKPRIWNSSRKSLMMGFKRPEMWMPQLPRRWTGWPRRRGSILAPVAPEMRKLVAARTSLASLTQED